LTCSEISDISAVSGLTNLTTLYLYSNQIIDISAVSGLNIENGELIVNREIDGGSQVLTIATPVVCIVQKGIAKEPRIPAMRGIMMARKKPLVVKEAIEANELTSFENFDLPPAKAACKMIEEENAKELITLLHEEAKVL
jgi:electron transfer flavoprotein beta subunit